MRELICAVLSTVVLSASAQHRYALENLPKHDQRPFHFGFHLGYNHANYQLITNSQVDSIVGLHVVPQSGFHFAIPVEWNASEFLKIRVFPIIISFQERTINYLIKPQRLDTIYTVHEKLESTFLEWPIHFKFRTARCNNFDAYVLGGGKFGLDVASRKNVSQGQLLKLDRQDYGYELGIGGDFFLPYVKLGLELRYAAGIPNLLIQEGNFYSKPLEAVRSRLWSFSLTFES